MNIGIPMTGLSRQTVQYSLKLGMNGNCNEHLLITMELI